MNHEDELMRYEEDAEERYDGYADEIYDEDDFDTGFDGLDDEDSFVDDEAYEEVEYIPAYEEEDGFDDAYDSYAAKTIGKIDPNDRTLTVVVKNQSGADAPAIIFGGFASEPQVAGVTVEIEESSHKEVREESKSNPFSIEGMRMSVSDPLQFDNVLKITNRTATGSNREQVFQPRNSTSPQNFSSNLILSQDFAMNVSGRDSIKFMVKDGVTVVFTFTIKARANLGNLLKGRNVAELSRTPQSTGLPQLDMLRKKKPKVVKKVVRRLPTRDRAAARRQRYNLRRRSGR